MERVGEWRLIEAEEPEKAQQPRSAAAGGNPGWRLIGALAAVAVLAIVGVAIWATLPQGSVTLDVAGQAGTVDFTAPSGQPAVAVTSTPEPRIVVDVEGAVAQPGVVELAAGSRVADAIAAAGGYSGLVDIAAAAQGLNLAVRVADGDKIHVPARGERQPLPAAGTGAPIAGPGLVDINRATSEELEGLPGIGPVTAGKIIAAREDLPFASIDELDTRGVVGPSTLEQIRDLITVAP